jgi:hypothetical protein
VEGSRLPMVGLRFEMKVHHNAGSWRLPPIRGRF